MGLGLNSMSLGLTGTSGVVERSATCAGGGRELGGVFGTSSAMGACLMGSPRPAGVIGGAFIGDRDPGGDRGVTVGTGGGGTGTAGVRAPVADGPVGATGVTVAVVVALLAGVLAFISRHQTVASSRKGDCSGTR